ncbi:CCA tRNA nucleotidyltransferase 1, mitochondrial [Trichoplax sp. H2]|nr:CCA tRNA nucleotidyltransferase 1, mitochondrial [Trichoplax sp. H2]|eukprot:RDD40122.1 CCA tRNA nucleotidyltransferase 1, mitochondrial [Trichoplax sp. H2]
MEMSKILVGNFAPDLLRLMYDLGVASHINLPKDGNVEEFQAIWDRMRNYKPQPAVLLASLVNSVSSAEALARTGSYRTWNDF